MAIRTQRTERPAGARSKAGIVEAATQILDEGGEEALAFRTLARHPATGSGAIRWRVADTDDRLAAAADEVVRRAATRLREHDDREQVPASLETLRQGAVRSRRRGRIASDPAPGAARPRPIPSRPRPS